MISIFNPRTIRTVRGVREVRSLRLVRSLESKKKLQCRKRPYKKKTKGPKANQSKATLRKKWLFQMGILNQGKYKSRSKKKGDDQE